MIGGLRPPKWKGQPRLDNQLESVFASSDHRKGSQPDEEVEDCIESLYATDEPADPIPDVPDSPNDSIVGEGQGSDASGKLSD